MVEPRIFYRFSGKDINLCILKGKMPFKMHKIIFFPEKKIVCLPKLKFSDLLPEIHLFFFIWPEKNTEKYTWHAYIRACLIIKLF